MDRVVVGRQGIHGRDFELVGYEVRLGSGPSLAAADERVEVVDLHLVVDRLVGRKQVFLDADRSMLVDPTRLSLLPAGSVIEVDPRVIDDPQTLDGCRALAELGFPIAVDDVRHTAGLHVLLDIASIAKVDARILSPDDVKWLSDECRAFDLRVLANRVETAEQLEQLLDVGLDLFQGDALGAQRFDRAERRRTLGAVNMARLQRSTTVLTQQLDFFEIEELLRTEPGLTYQVLQLASLGRAGELRRAVSSVREALVLAGSWRIQSWISMLLACPTGSDEVPVDAIVAALTRARACELLAPDVREPARTGFAAGLVSSFEQLLELPASELADQLPLSDELRAAAFGDTTPLGRLVRDVSDRQGSDADRPARSGLAGSQLDAALAAGLHWAVAAAGLLD